MLHQLFELTKDEENEKNIIDMSSKIFMRNPERSIFTRDRDEFRSDAILHELLSFS